MKNKLTALYQGAIIEHSKRPRHYRKMDDADQLIEAYNPFCGDKFKLYFKLEEDTITDISFHGYGCAVSKASTSVLVSRLSGKSLTEVRLICRQFYAVVQDPELPVGAPADFSAFRAARDFPARIKCATLSWDAIGEKLLDIKPSP